MDKVPVVQEQEGEEEPILHLAETSMEMIFIGVLCDRMVVTCPVLVGESDIL